MYETSYTICYVKRTCLSSPLVCSENLPVVATTKILKIKFSRHCLGDSGRTLFRYTRIIFIFQAPLKTKQKPETYRANKSPLPLPLPVPRCFTPRNRKLPLHTSIRIAALEAASAKTASRYRFHPTQFPRAVARSRAARCTCGRKRQNARNESAGNGKKRSPLAVCFAERILLFASRVVSWSFDCQACSQMD